MANGAVVRLTEPFAITFSYVISETPCKMFFFSLVKLTKLGDINDQIKIFRKFKGNYRKEY